jgi:hypothetical protein
MVLGALPERGAGWTRCLHLRKQIRALLVATFRLVAHDQGVNAMHFGPRKQQHSQRVCQLCTKNCIDYERHVFECPAQAFAELRAQYPLLPSLPSYHSTPDPDTTTQQCMELEKEQQWPELADYQIKHFALLQRFRSLRGIKCIQTTCRLKLDQPERMLECCVAAVQLQMPCWND